MIQVFDDMFCPLCGRRMQKNDWAYGCSGWRENDNRCRFLVWKDFRGHTFTDDEMMRLLCGETIGPLKFKRKGIAAYSASVCMDWDQLEPVVTGPIRLVKKGRPAAADPADSADSSPGDRKKNMGIAAMDSDPAAAHRTIGSMAPQRAGKGVEIEWLDE